MKLTSPWLPSAMTLSSLFLAGSVAGSLAGAPVDEVAFKPSEGLALTRTFTTAHEMVLDDMSITMNGQPLTSPERDKNKSMNATMVVDDEFA